MAAAPLRLDILASGLMAEGTVVVGFLAILKKADRSLENIWETV